MKLDEMTSPAAAGPALDGLPVRAGFGGSRDGVAAMAPAELIYEFGSVVEAEIRRLPLVAVRNAVADADDLRQEGLLALMDAQKAYDPSRGVPFAAFARTCVHHALAGALRRNDPLPETVRRDLRTVRSAQEAHGLARHISVHDLAERTGLSVARVRSVLTWAERHDRGNEEIQTDLACPATVGPEDAALMRDDADRLAAAVAALPAQTRRILMGRLVAGVPLKQMAMQEGVSVSRISQVASAAVRQLTQVLDEAY